MLPFFEQKENDLFVYEYSDFSFPAHFHPALEVIYAVDGQIKIVIEGNCHMLYKGQLGIIFPDTVHYYENVKDTASRGFLFLLKKNLLGDYKKDIEGMQLKNPIYNLSSLHPDTKTALFALRSLSNGSFREKKAYTYLLLCHLFPYFEIAEKKEGSENLLYRLVNYMEKHYTENITLDNLAEELFVSKYYLSRIFNDRLGMNFNDYLNNLRVRYAIELLNKDKSIASICYESGFNNLRTFNRAFKKATGKTPKELLSDKY